MATSKNILDPFVLFLDDLSKAISKDELNSLKRHCLSCGILVPEDATESLSAGDIFFKLHQMGLALPGNYDTFISLLEALPRVDLVKKFHRFLAEGNLSEQPKPTSYIIKEVSDYLRTFYRSRLSEVQPLPWCHDFFLPLNDVYTNLQFTEKDRRGRLSDAFPLKVSDLFGTIAKSARMPRRVRVEGSPGIGKSTFSQKILYEWACGKLPQFSAAFLLEMRDFSGTIADAIFDQFPEEYKNKFKQDELWAELLTESKNLLFIVDGLDEVDPKILADSDLNRLIQGQTMYESTVVVTSRPHEFDAILKYCHPNLRITGYSPKDRDNFICNYFKDRKGTAESLIQEVRSKRVLSEICQTPLNTILLCVLWEDNAGNLPSTVTELYAELVLAITKSYVANRSEVANKDADQVPDDIAEKLCKLGEYAWRGLRENRLIFQQSEITPAELLLTGFLTKDVGVSRIKRSKTCNFLHKTFQEYFAGFYITSKIQNGGDAGTDVRELLENEHFAVCSFASGLLKADASPILREYAENLDKHKSDRARFERLLLSSLACLHETGNGDSLARIVASQLPPTLSLTSYHSYSFIHSEYEQRQIENAPVNLHLDQQSLQGLGSVLQSSPESHSENRGGVRKLIMGRMFDPELCADVLAQLSGETAIESLETDIFLDPSQTNAVSSAIERCTSIKEVNLNFFRMKNTDSDEKVAQVMCASVAKVTEGLNGNSERGKFRLVLDLSSPVVPFPNLPLELFKAAPLEELDLQVHSMLTIPQQPLIESLGEVLRDSKSLKKLSFLLLGVPPGADIDFTPLRDALEENKTLAYFKLWSLGVGPIPTACCPDVTPLFQALEINDSLEEFSVTVGEQSNGVCDVLHRNSTLRSLTIFFSDDIGELVVSVLRAVSHHKALNRLFMRYNGPMSSDVLNCLSGLVHSKDGAALETVVWDTLNNTAVQIDLKAIESFRDLMRTNETLREFSLPPIAPPEDDYARVVETVKQIQESMRQRVPSLKLVVIPPPQKIVPQPLFRDRPTVNIYGSDKSQGPAFVVKEMKLLANEEVLDAMSETERNGLVDMIAKYEMHVIEIPEQIKKKYFKLHV